jgi:heavy metal sensor kinase
VAFLFFYFFITSVIRDGIDQDLLSKVKTFSSIASMQGVNAVVNTAVIETKAAGEKKVFFKLIDISGQIFSTSNISYWKDIKVDKARMKKLINGSGPIFQVFSSTNRKHKVRILYSFIHPRVIIQIGQSMDNYTRIIEIFKKAFVTTMTVLILLAALIGSFLAKRALAGVGEVTRTARRISEGSLDERVPVKSKGDEVDQLAITFNDMLDRIQKLIIATKDMSDNIAHDLRSHVTRIRGSSEIALTTNAPIEEYQNVAAGTVEECDRLLDMINTMLIISKTESGVEEINRTRIDVKKTVDYACELFQPMAENKGLKLICNVPDNIILKGDIRKIQRMISNLLDNAIKYTPSGGKVEVSAFLKDGKSVIISVKDSGIGIEEKDIPHIFNRFYRCDASRTEGGAGLGLSLAKAIAQAHGGNISVNSRRDSGSHFLVDLPADVA